MYGFSMMANSLRTLVEQGRMTEEQVKRDIEIYEFLATCDEMDFCRLVDSSAFNDIISAYLELVLDRVNIDDKTKSRALTELRYVFDELTAIEVLGKLRKIDNL